MASSDVISSAYREYDYPWFDLYDEHLLELQPTGRFHNLQSVRRPHRSGHLIYLILLTLIALPILVAKVIVVFDHVAIMDAKVVFNGLLWAVTSILSVEERLSGWLVSKSL